MNPIIVHQQKQMQLVGGRRPELGDQVEVEVPRFGRFGVDEKTATADVGAEDSYPGDDVA